MELALFAIYTVSIGISDIRNLFRFGSHNFCKMVSNIFVKSEHRTNFRHLPRFAAKSVVALLGSLAPSGSW